MKKLIYFMMIAIVVATSCKKEEIVEPEPPKPIPIISFEELIGYWTTIKWEYDGNTYTECDDVKFLMWLNDKGAILLEIEFNNDYPWTDDNGVPWGLGLFHDMCGGNWGSQNYYFIDIEKNQIIFADHLSLEIRVLFQVLEYNKEEQILKFELTKTKPSMSFINSIYTMKKL